MFDDATQPDEDFGLPPPMLARGDAPQRVLHRCGARQITFVGGVSWRTTDAR